ncbi:MAG: sulfatase-like hydrolase/transferase [Actinomycetota bacterium]
MTDEGSAPPAEPGTNAPRFEVRRLPRPYYPILFAAFPVLHLFRTNIDEVSTGQALAPLGLVVGAAGIVLGLAWLALRDVRRAGLIATLLVLLFFSYGYVADAVEDWELAGVSVGRDRYLLAGWALLAIAGGYLLLRVRRSLLPELTRILNGVAVVLVATTVVPIAADKLTGPDEVQALSRPTTIPTAHEIREGKRDIYYVNFDRYGGEDSLGPNFDYDNRPFLSSLEQKGFVVAHHARANYPNTGHSMTSMLNMTYLDDVAKQVGDSGDWGPLYGLLKEHAVGRFLKSQGYRYVHIGNWFEGTRSSPLADEVVSYDPLSEFSRTLLETTPLGALSKSLGIGDDKLDSRRVAWARVLFQFDQMLRAGNDGKPTFVLAHIILPHEPYVFERDGSFLTAEKMKSRHWHRNYLESLLFANTLMTEIADHLLAGPDATDPIIILASDEGPPPGTDKSNTNPDPEAWISKTTKQLRQKFPILAAFYLPGADRRLISQAITPVNFFRSIFSLYFGADLPLLADDSFVWFDKDHLYTFESVTERVRAEPALEDG